MRLWTFRTSRARPVLLAAALLAAHAGGAARSPEKSLPSLDEAVQAICSKKMNKDVKKALSQQEGKKALSKEDVKKALSQQCDALSTLVLASSAETNLTKDTRTRLEASRASSTAGSSRPVLTSTDFIQAVDALYLPLQVYSDQKTALANVIIDIALTVPAPAENFDKVALRRGILRMLRFDTFELLVGIPFFPSRGILRMLQSDKEGAKEEFRKALKQNPDAVLPDSVGAKMRDVLEAVRKEFPPSKPLEVTPKVPVTDGLMTRDQTQNPTKPPIELAKTTQGAQPLAWVATVAGVGLLVGGGFMGKQAYDYHQAERSASAAGDYDAYEKSRGQAVLTSVLADTCYLAGAVSAAWGIYSLLKPAPGLGSLAVTPGAGARQALLVSGRF